MCEVNTMDKLVGTIVGIDADKDDIWFSVKTTLSTAFTPKKQEVFFDCRIACDDKNINFDEVVDRMKLAKDDLLVELDGYMMVDTLEENEMQMWFSVFKMTIKGVVIYDSPDVSEQETIGLDNLDMGADEYDIAEELKKIKEMFPSEFKEALKLIK
jgi:hypothetical protein